MKVNEPLLPTTSHQDTSYSCREETVKLCFDGQRDYCSGFFLRNALGLCFGTPIILLDIAYTLAGNTDGQWMSYIGLAIAVSQVATGIFCEYIHKPFKTEYCGYPCFNHFNLIAGSLLGAVSIGLLIYQDVEGG